MIFAKGLCFLNSFSDFGTFLLRGDGCTIFCLHETKKDKIKDSEWFYEHNIWVVKQKSETYFDWRSMFSDKVNWICSFDYVWTTKYDTKTKHILEVPKTSSSRIYLLLLFWWSIWESHEERRNNNTEIS